MYTKLTYTVCIILALCMLSNACGATKPRNPYPADGAVDVPLDVVLKWTARGMDWQDVFFGTDRYNVNIAREGSAEHKCTTVVDAYDPGGLEPCIPYYWKIVGYEDWGEIIFVHEGPLWSFTTVCDAGECQERQEPIESRWCECCDIDPGYAMHISVSYGVVYTNVPICKVHCAEGISLELGLHYDSGKADGSISRRKTVLGYGWTHNYNIHLIVKPPDVFMPDSKGRMTRFKEQADGSYQASAGWSHTLSQIDEDTFLLEQVDGKKLSFELFESAPWPTCGSLYQLTQIEDAQGQVRTLSYNTKGLLETIADPFGRQMVLDYDENGSIIRITNADGTATQIEYSNDNVSRITDPLGYTLEYTYDSENRMTTEKLKDGNTWTCLYNDGNKPYQLIDGDGQLYATLTNPLNWAIDNDRLQQFSEVRYIPSQTTVTDGEGNITYYDYDENAYITHRYAPDHPGAMYEFDDELRLVRHTDEEGNQRQYEYDEHGNIIRVTDPLGNETKMFHEHPTIRSLMTKKIEPDSDQYLYDYDENGNLIREIDPIIEEPNDKVITHTYNAQGLRTSTTDRNGNVTQWQYNGDGTLARQTVDPNPLNIVTEYEYDTAGRMTKKTLYRGPNLTDPVVTIYDYDADGRLIKEVLDPNGLNLTTQYEHDGEGRIVRRVDPRGIITDYEYDVRGRLIKEAVDPGGLNLTTRYEYDEADNQTKLIDAKGNETRYEYDDRNRLTKSIDPEGYQTLYDYGENGTLIRSSRSMDPCGPPYHITEYRYDQLGRQTHKIIDPCGLALTTEFEYALPGSAGCPCGTPGSAQVHKKTDPSGKVIYYYYDQLDRITREVRKVGDTDDNAGDANDAINTYEYDYMGNCIRQTAENSPHINHVTTYLYDAANRLIRQVEGPSDSNLTTSYVYNGAGNVIQQTTPQGNVIRNAYDKANRLVNQSDSVGPLVSYDYDENGNIIRKTDGLGHTWRYTYDGADRLTAVYDPLVESPADKFTAYNYDENGNIIQEADNEDSVTTYTYDGLDRRIKLSHDPCDLAVEITYAYDSAGNLIRINDDNGNATTYEYDAANRKIREIYADETTIQYEYDEAGSVIRRTDQMGNITTYSYDDLHRLTSRTYADGRRDMFTYNRAGRLFTADNDHSHIEQAYDDVGRMTSSTQTDLPQSYSCMVGYDYNTPDNTRTITYPSGKEVVEVRDGRGRLTEVRQDSVKTTWHAYDNPGNRLRARHFANGTRTEYIYNENGWVTELRHIGPDGATFAGFAYDYDAAGNPINAINVQSVLAYEDAKPVTQSEKYTYDAMDRLIDFKQGKWVDGDIPAPTRHRTWQLDGVYNWMQFSVDGTNYHNSVNQMNEYDDLSTDGPAPVPDDDGEPDDFMVGESSGFNFAHDKNGNVVDDGVQQYFYDYDHQPVTEATLRADNNLTMVKVKINGAVLGQYWYDALGRRTRKLTGEVPTIYIYNDRRTIEEYNDSALVRSYTYDSKTNEILTMERAAEGDKLYYHSNAQGSIIAITDNTGDPIERYNYDAYGEPSFWDGAGNEIPQSVVGNPYMFTGQRLDQETGLYYLGSPYYDSAKGRLLQRNPLGYADGMNLYDHLNNNLTEFDLPEYTDADTTVWQPRRCELGLPRDMPYDVVYFVAAGDKTEDKILDKCSFPFLTTRNFKSKYSYYSGTSAQDCKDEMKQVTTKGTDAYNWAKKNRCAPLCKKKLDKKCKGKCWIDKGAKKKGTCQVVVEKIKLRKGSKYYTGTSKCHVKIKCWCKCDCLEKKPEPAPEVHLSDTFVQHETEYWRREYERQMRALHGPPF